MISFIQKHWKKIVLALCALFWSGCGDEQLCTAYGIIYICDGVRTYGQMPENAENCTSEPPPCAKNYICDDGIVCTESQTNGVKKFDCKEGTYIMPSDKITSTYTEEEFDAKYYVKN